MARWPVQQQARPESSQTPANGSLLPVHFQRRAARFIVRIAQRSAAQRSTSQHSRARQKRQLDSCHSACCVLHTDETRSRHFFWPPRSKARFVLVASSTHTPTRHTSWKPDVSIDDTLADPPDCPICSCPMSCYVLCLMLSPQAPLPHPCTTGWLLFFVCLSRINRARTFYHPTGQHSRLMTSPDPASLRRMTLSRDLAPWHLGRGASEPA